MFAAAGRIHVHEHTRYCSPSVHMLLQPLCVSMHASVFATTRVSTTCVCLIKRDCYYRTHAHICKYAFVCECTRLLSQETNAGNFVADLMRHAVDADIAILNSGTLRADAVLGPGLLRMKDLVALLPMQVGDVLCLPCSGGCDLMSDHRKALHVGGGHTTVRRVTGGIMVVVTDAWNPFVRAQVESFCAHVNGSLSYACVVYLRLL